jgi:hypothetical protein
MKSISDGKFNRVFAENSINEYNVQYLENYIKENNINIFVRPFLGNELMFLKKNN